MQRMLHITTSLAVLLAVAANASAQPFSIGASEDRRFGGASGTLIISAESIAFRSEKADDARAWPYDAIRELRIDAKNRLTLDSYEGRGWTRLRQGTRRFTYRLTGEGLPPQAIDLLLARVARPMVTRVMPARPGSPEWSLSARHEGRDRAAGALQLFADGLAFHAARPEDSRFWRFTDIASVLPLDPFRLEVTAREADGLKPFTFQLAEALPPGFRDAVWARLNPPAPWQRDGGAPMVAGGVR